MPITTFAEAQVLNASGPAADLFLSGVSLFELTNLEPPVQRATVTAVNLPDPGTFGVYTGYLATLAFETPEGGTEVITDLPLLPTPDEEVWAGSILLTFGGTLAPIVVTVYPYRDSAAGPVILEGPVFTA